MTTSVAESRAARERTAETPRIVRWHGDQTPLEVATAVKEQAAGLKQQLPKGLEVARWVDRSEMYETRIDLLLDNALVDLLLVLLTLGRFLQARLALWVTLGILAATLIMLLIVPSCYLILEDLIATTKSFFAHLRKRPTLIPPQIRDLAREPAE